MTGAGCFGGAPATTVAGCFWGALKIPGFGEAPAMTGASCFGGAPKIPGAGCFGDVLVAATAVALPAAAAVGAAADDAAAAAAAVVPGVLTRDDPTAALLPAPSPPSSSPSPAPLDFAEALGAAPAPGFVRGDGRAGIGAAAPHIMQLGVSGSSALPQVEHSKVGAGGGGAAVTSSSSVAFMNASMSYVSTCVMMPEWLPPRATQQKISVLQEV
jgi:hypothetical protein